MKTYELIPGRNRARDIKRRLNEHGQRFVEEFLKRYPSPIAFLNTPAYIKKHGTSVKTYWLDSGHTRQDEALELAWQAICYAACFYDPAKSRPTTFFPIVIYQRLYTEMIKRRRKVSLLQSVDEHVDSENLKDDSVSECELFDVHDEFQHVTKTCDDIPWWPIVYRHHIQGVTFVDIAKELGQSANLVRYKYARAIDMARQRLEVSQ